MTTLRCGNCDSLTPMAFLTANMASVVLTVLLLSHVHDKTEGVTLNIEGNRTSFTIPLGKTSEIMFYVRDWNFREELRIFVQHKAEGKNNYERKCFVSKSAAKICRSSSNICHCLGNASQGFDFKLQKTFLQKDSGSWLFAIWSPHESASKTIWISVENLFSTKAPKQATENPGRYRNKSTDTNTGTSTSRGPKVASSIPLENVATIPVKAPFIHYAQNGAAKQKIHQAEPQNGIIAVFVILSLVTIFSLISSVVLWRYPGCALRLRRALRLGETRNGHPDHSNIETCDAPCRDVSHGHPPSGSKGVLNSSDYLTPVFEPSRPAPEDTDTRDAICKESSRLTTACAFVKTPAIPHSDYGYLTPTFDPRTRREEKEKPNEASIGVPALPLSVAQLQGCLTSSAIKEANLPTMLGCHGDHGLYLTPSPAPSTGKVIDFHHHPAL